MDFAIEVYKVIFSRHDLSFFRLDKFQLKQLHFAFPNSPKGPINSGIFSIKLLHTATVQG